ncbi:hypothetical protein [Butyrivibrio sp. WCD2001]|uniref:hypothetical protein n=1 Tax=Butyrivibrio sp. WCD2001 TaxID=1280681 RepID=UPI000427ED3A|nr:hypothetical protein [Butyrivibrio sp. WCD2001]
MAKKNMSNDEKRELAWDEARVRNKEEIAKVVAFLKLDMNTFEIEYSTKCKLLMLGDYFSHDLKSLVKRSKSHSEELKA